METCTVLERSMLTKQIKHRHRVLTLFIMTFISTLPTEILWHLSSKFFFYIMYSVRTLKYIIGNSALVPYRYSPIFIWEVTLPPELVKLDWETQHMTVVSDEINEIAVAGQQVFSQVLERIFETYSEDAGKYFVRFLASPVLL